MEEHERIRGIVPEQLLEVMGAVVPSVEFRDPGGIRVSQVMRFKILPKGTCDWTGLVIGGPSWNQRPWVWDCDIAEEDIIFRR